MINFGIEYETCVLAKSNPNQSWINSLTSVYIPKLREQYNKTPNIQVWADTFGCRVLINDDNSNTFSFFLNDSNEPVLEVNEDILVYKYPLLTIDSSIVCHLTARKHHNKTEYHLLEDQYSINLEIVSQILHNHDELHSFFELFIDPFVPSLFIRNKSQGIHLNIDISSLTHKYVKRILLDKYIPWEANMAQHVRPYASDWAKPITSDIINRFINTNISDLFHKTDSIRYKPNIKILEFRILSPYAPNLIKCIKDIIGMFEKNETFDFVGGLRVKTRKAKKSKKKTRKVSTIRKRTMSTDLYVFVYGSLRRGLQNHHKLEFAEYKGEWQTKNYYYMTGMKSGAYPYVSSVQLHEDQSPTKVYGELYIVNNDLLKILDELEGHPTQYMRQKIDIVNNRNECVNAYMYILENKELQDGIRLNFKRRFVPVNDGDWVAYIRQKN